MTAVFLAFLSNSLFLLLIFVLFACKIVIVGAISKVKLKLRKDEQNNDRKTVQKGRLTGLRFLNGC